MFQLVLLGVTSAIMKTRHRQLPSVTVASAQLDMLTMMERAMVSSCLCMPFFLCMCVCVCVCEWVGEFMRLCVCVCVCVTVIQHVYIT